MNKWKIIDTGLGSAQQNMDIDKKLLEKVGKDPQPIVHLYEWEGLCATYGYFAKPAELLNMEGVKQYSLQLGRRPTGGGVIFHVCDLAFSVIVPATHPRFSLNTLDNYAFINEAVIRAIKRFTGESLSPSLYDHEQLQQRQMEDNFCMAKPTQYDVMVDGFKVGGAAQRRTKEGFLHQGSISLAMPTKDFLKAVLRVDSNIFDAMQACSYTLLDGQISSKELEHARLEMRQHLLDSLF
jgi:lipoate---protein ligase